MIGPTPETWQWFGFRCSTCERIQLVRKVDHGDGSGHGECWICGANAGWFWANYGTIDLGLAGESVDPESASDFEIFP